MKKPLPYLLQGVMPSFQDFHLWWQWKGQTFQEDQDNWCQTIGSYILKLSQALPLKHNHPFQPVAQTFFLPELRSQNCEINVRKVSRFIYKKKLLILSTWSIFFLDPKSKDCEDFCLFRNVLPDDTLPPFSTKSGLDILFEWLCQFFI